MKKEIGCDGFTHLTPGDVIEVGGFGKATVTGKPYYNHDCDEPGLEVETTNGVVSIDNEIYITGHDTGYDEIER